MSATYSRNFFWERASKFAIFSSVFFSGRIILKNIENKKGFGEVRGRALPENL